LATAAEVDELMELSLESLMQIEVTSVAKKAQSLEDTTAAIYVITREDILRSGATTIPEALRLAPGVDVARTSSNQWAIAHHVWANFYSVLRIFNDRHVMMSTKESRCNRGCGSERIPFWPRSRYKPECRICTRQKTRKASLRDSKHDI